MLIVNRIWHLGFSRGNAPNKRGTPMFCWGVSLPGPELGTTLDSCQKCSILGFPWGNAPNKFLAQKQVDSFRFFFLHPKTTNHKAPPLTLFLVSEDMNFEGWSGTRTMRRGKWTDAAGEGGLPERLTLASIGGSPYFSFPLVFEVGIHVTQPFFQGA